MWLYSQRTGELWNGEGQWLASGYSGFGSGKNNPNLEDVRNVGPIPRGLYKIGTAYDSSRVGPCAIPLEPVDHDCHGRCDFRAHGDSRSNPGTASKGCIILPRKIRNQICDSEDKQLKVIE